MRKIQFRDLGLSDYGSVLSLQEELMQEVIGRKMHNQEMPGTGWKDATDYLLFVEHPPVYTLGKSGEMQNLMLDESQLAEKEISFYRTNRGGDITFHGPGQLVGYPILDLENFGLGLRHYIYSMEEAVIRTLTMYGITGVRDPGATGVWIGEGTPEMRKICAIGVKTSRHVTMHGFALNVNTRLDYFRYINPCGIRDKGITSVEMETGKTVDMQELKSRMLNSFLEVFGAELA